MAKVSAALSVVCGHVKFFINDLELARELLATLPLESKASASGAQVSETAVQAQNLIADKLAVHCASLRDAVFHSKHIIRPSTKKLLTNLNATHSAHKHSTSVSSADLLHKLECELDAFIESSSSSVRDHSCNRSRCRTHYGGSPRPRPVRQLQPPPFAPSCDESFSGADAGCDSDADSGTQCERHERSATASRISSVSPSASKATVEGFAENIDQEQLNTMMDMLQGMSASLTALTAGRPP